MTMSTISRGRFLVLHLGIQAAVNSALLRVAHSLHLCVILCILGFGLTGIVIFEVTMLLDQIFLQVLD